MHVCQASEYKVFADMLTYGESSLARAFLLEFPELLALSVISQPSYTFTLQGTEMITYPTSRCFHALTLPLCVSSIYKALIIHVMSDEDTCKPPKYATCASLCALDQSLQDVHNTNTPINNLATP